MINCTDMLEMNFFKVGGWGFQFVMVLFFLFDTEPFPWDKLFFLSTLRGNPELPAQAE